MRYLWMDEYLLNKRSVTKDLQPVWNWVRYHIGGKMFAALCLDRENQPYYITLKVDPAEGEFLRSQYPDIVAGYYCDKRNWISVKPDGAVPDALLESLLDNVAERTVNPAHGLQINVPAATPVRERYFMRPHPNPAPSTTVRYKNIDI